MNNTLTTFELKMLSPRLAALLMDDTMPVGEFNIIATALIAVKELQAIREKEDLAITIEMSSKRQPRPKKGKTLIEAFGS